ncbi:hypothetical protein [Streptomyces anulatus]|nr:hypothetical protein OH791_38790 [Streptomyces anulatus]
MSLSFQHGQSPAVIGDVPVGVGEAGDTAISEVTFASADWEL